MSKITLGKFLDAMEKNGWRKARGMMIRRTGKFDAELGNYKVSSACAVGQAALNLKAEPGNLVSAINLATNGKLYENHPMISDIFRLNDTTATSVPEIARLMREKYKDQLNIEFEV